MYRTNLVRLIAGYIAFSFGRATGSFFTSTRETHSNTKESSVNGSIMIMNLAIPIPDTEYKYRFCGFPGGISILPRLAAIVWSTTVTSSCFFLPHIINKSTANGTNVISATSFVTSMLKKKHSITSAAASWTVLFVLASRALPIRRNTNMLWNPAITAISENSNEIVLKSI